MCRQNNLSFFRKAQKNFSRFSTLGWGMIDYQAQYKEAGEWTNALDSLRWALEYFIRAHTSEFEFYGQVKSF